MIVSFYLGKPAPVYVKNFNSSEELVNYLQGLMVGMIQGDLKPTGMRVEFVFPPIVIVKDGIAQEKK